MLAVPPCFAPLQEKSFHEEAIKCSGTSYELCFWQHSFSAVTGVPVLDYFRSSGRSEGYFDCLLTEDLAPAVFSLYVSISALLRLRHRFSIQLLIYYTTICLFLQLTVQYDHVLL